MWSLLTSLARMEVCNSNARFVHGEVQFGPLGHLRAKGLSTSLYDLFNPVIQVLTKS